MTVRTSSVLADDTNARALLGLGIKKLDVADVDRRILLNAAALGITLAGPHVFPHAVDAFDHYAVLVGDDAAGLWQSCGTHKDVDDLFTGAREEISRARKERPQERRASESNGRLES